MTPTTKLTILTRDAAVTRLKQLLGKDLRPLADKFGVTVFKNGKLNKGWPGQVLEKYLGLGLSSKQAPNGQFWELKVVSLKHNKKGNTVPKETMQITMINSKNALEPRFEESYLFHKLRSLIICGRLFEGREEKHSTLVSVGVFDIGDKEIYEQVKKDYELVRDTIRTKGFNSLTGKMGVLVQPRTKGPGHGSTSRAFYARTMFVKELLGLD